MRKMLGLGGWSSPCCAPRSSPAAQARESAVVNINFATYVWQPTTVAATKSIVEAWNKSHPEIQVEIVAVDLELGTRQAPHQLRRRDGGRRDPRRGGRHRRFHGAGLPREPDSAPPEDAVELDPEDIWSTVNFGGKITGVPSLMQTYNIFANMAIFKEAGVKAPTSPIPWTWAEFRAAAKKLTNSNRFGVCWGLRSPTAAIQTISLNYGGQFIYLQNGSGSSGRGRGAERRAQDARHDPRRQVRRPGRDRSERQRASSRRSSAASVR